MWIIIYWSVRVIDLSLIWDKLQGIINQNVGHIDHSSQKLGLEEMICLIYHSVTKSAVTNVQHVMEPCFMAFPNLAVVRNSQPSCYYDSCTRNKQKNWHGCNLQMLVMKPASDFFHCGSPLPPVGGLPSCHVTMRAGHFPHFACSAHTLHLYPMTEQFEIIVIEKMDSSSFKEYKICKSVIRLSRLE